MTTTDVKSITTNISKNTNIVNSENTNIVNGENTNIVNSGAKFRIGYMDNREQREMERMDKPDTTCWYCDRSVCNLTHKYSPRGKAKRPQDDPYKHY